MRPRVIRPTGASAERWAAPALRAGAADAARGRAAPGPGFAPDTRGGTAAVDEDYRQGREEGFARGHAEGLEAARAETAATLAALSALAGNLLEPLARLDEQVDDELARLALAVARQVVRRELTSDPQQIAAVVREARGALNDVRGRLRIALHPDEAPLVRRLFSDDETLAGVDVEEDPSITRGGCTLSTDVSFVDATVETRIARIAVQLLGDERQRADAGDD